MGIYRVYIGESRPVPVTEVTLSEYKTESDSLVGCKIEELSDLNYILADFLHIVKQHSSLKVQVFKGAYLGNSFKVAVIMN
jgi:hypothetical protein